jgi:mannose/cellobiose epimerase-like protein (N-acyl-D-glucosamine 2-epimerase family)
MTNSDQQLIQDAFALLAACIAQVAAKDTAGSVRWAFLSEALYAAETIEALTDPTRDAFAPTGFPQKAAPDMHFQRLMLTQSLLIGQSMPKHPKVAA